MKKGFLSAPEGAWKVKAAAVANVDKHALGTSKCGARLISLLDSAKTLLASGHVSAASHAADCAGKSQTEGSSLPTDVQQIIDDCKKKEQQVLERAKSLAAGKGPPIDALLEILKNGIETNRIWQQLHQALQESLGQFGAMLEQVGLLSKESFLLHTCSPAQDAKQLYVLAPLRAFGGTWVNVPCCSQDVAKLAAHAAGLCTSFNQPLAEDAQDTNGYRADLVEPNNKTCFWQVVQGAAWPSCRPLLLHEQWAVLCNGDWVELVGPVPDHQESSGTWPPRRCAAELVHGELPRPEMSGCSNQQDSSPCQLFQDMSAKPCMNTLLCCKCACDGVAVEVSAAFPGYALAKPSAWPPRRSQLWRARCI